MVKAGATQLPLAAFDQHAAIIGMPGSGKSWLGRLIVEAWLQQSFRVCIVDPTDVWWGLKSAAAGNKPGYPVAVFGGDHADVPLGPRSGERVAEIIATRNLPAIVSPAGMTGAEQHRFMTDFLGTLYRLNRNALHLVLDEADEFAPQNPLPETRRMLGAVDRIARRGRVRGFRILMITQRPAVLHNNVLATAQTVAALRLALPHDRDAFERWIRGQGDPADGRRVLDSLAGLRQGEGWIWAPGQALLQRQNFPRIRTFDSMRTPEHGEVEAATPSRLAPVEIADLKMLLASEEPAGDGPAGTSSTTGGYSKDDIEAAEGRGHERGQKDGWVRGYGAALDDIERVIGDRLADLRLDAGVIKREVKKSGTHGAAAPATAAGTAPPKEALEEFAARGQAAQKAVDAATARAADEVPKELPPVAVRMLAVLKSRGAALTWPQLAVIAGVRYGKAVFNVARAVLRRRGLVAEAGEAVELTAGGRALTDDVAVAVPSSPAELVDWWVDRLPPSNPMAGRMLRLVVVADRAGIDPRDLAETLGVTYGKAVWNVAFATLRRNGLAAVDADGRIRAAAELLDG